ncbi:REP-associated tyrosine transposase [Celerinatantimonas yamalensis]|uniref:Transposase IS200-like domain-containing protein n=1 Tax=Celerinatantimonas yamalensis TaxID=559956 RepID=A0ABW9G508_9GAMM
MTSYRRTFQPNGCYVFTLHQVDSPSYSYLLENIKLLATSVSESLCRYPCIIQSMTVLPSQLHMMVYCPLGESNFHNFVRMLQQQFTNHIAPLRVVRSFTPYRRSSVWQTEYHYHLIHDVQQWLRYRDDIHAEVVRQGIVDKAINWPYSSLHQYVEEGRLDADWVSPYIDEKSLFSEKTETFHDADVVNLTSSGIGLKGQFVSH